MSDRKCIIETVTTVYENLYHSTLPTANTGLVHFTEKQIEVIQAVPPILKSDVGTALKEVKKSPEADKITNDYLKLAEEELVSTLIDLFNEVLQTKNIPSQWKSNNMILIKRSKENK